MNEPYVEISQHAKEQMRERGATEDEVVSAITKGEVEPAHKGRTMYRVPLKTYSANICVICGRIFPGDFADYRR